MTHFHCLHGAWHGGWVWVRLQEGLQKLGHTVTAPDLPGLGEHAGELSAATAEAINLESHYSAANPEARCVIVAHSYAGMLARLIADRFPDKVSHLVLIEALWPDDGQCALDLVSAEARFAIEASIRTEGQGVVIPPPAAEQFHITNAELRQQVSARLTPQPANTFRDVVKLQGAEPIGTYLISTDREPQPYADTATRLEARGWHIVKSSGGHALMLTQPDFLIRLLHELSQKEPLCDVN
ncbi:MAG: alpha/beta fold hydrolase [Gammaproteobacteria bacterium]|nr:alpha/beta fold hydrolase [Gammaproteobacteria bacterium]